MQTSFTMQTEVYRANDKVVSVESNVEVPCLSEIVTSEDNVYNVVMEISCRQVDRPAQREGYADNQRPDESINDRSLINAFVEERSSESTIQHQLTSEQQADLFAQFEARIYEFEV